MKRVLVLILLTACRTNTGENPDVTPDPTPPEEENPSEYIFEEESPELALSIGAIEEAIEETVEILQRLDPIAVHEAYEEAKQAADENCPILNDAYDYDFWSESCETEAGASFTGQVAYWRYQDYQDEYYDIAEDAYYNGDAKVTTADGDIFVGSGYSRRESKKDLNGDNRYQWWQAWGEFSWSGPSADGSWISDDYTVDFSMWSGNYYAQNYATYTSFNGGVSGLKGEINTLLMRDIMIYGEELGSECDLEPYGTVSVRDNSGNWVDVVFDGPAYWGAWAFQPHCDGCGMAYFRGEELGPVCTDFSTFMNFERFPW